MGSPTLAQLLAAHPGAQTFRFGEDADLMFRILRLVRQGTKTATCDALHLYDPQSDAMPKVGRRDIALNFDGSPALMIETLRVETCRFDEIDAEFVRAHGEFKTLDDWRAAYRRELASKGAFSEDMALMCEHFRLVEDYA